jgi:hypothetical protein
MLHIYISKVSVWITGQPKGFMAFLSLSTEKPWSVTTAHDCHLWNHHLFITMTPFQSAPSVETVSLKNLIINNSLLKYHFQKWMKNITQPHICMFHYQVRWYNFNHFSVFWSQVITTTSFLKQRIFIYRKKCHKRECSTTLKLKMKIC